MSYRGATLPDRALESALSNMLRRLAILESRARWSGATQFVENLTPQTYSNNVWTTLCSLELDPGAWLLYGAGTVQAEEFTSQQQVRFPQADGITSTATAGSDGFNPAITTLTVVAKIRLTTRTTVILETRSVATSLGAESTASFIIAIPT